MVVISDFYDEEHLTRRELRRVGQHHLDGLPPLSRVRAFGVGQGSGAMRARARIDAEMRARAAGRNPRSTIPEPNAFERGLRRKLTSVEVILAQSTFAGERAAASKARDRLRAQLGKDAEPIEDA